MSKKENEEKNELTPETSTENISDGVDKTFESMNKLVDENLNKTEEETAPETEPVIEEPVVEVEEKIETPVVTEETATEELLNETDTLGIEVNQPEIVEKDINASSALEPVIVKDEVSTELKEGEVKIIVDEQTLKDNPELTDEGIKPGDELTINLKASFVEGENLLTQDHFDEMPDLTETGFVVGDILIYEDGKPFTKKEVKEEKAPIEFDPENQKFARVQELIQQENYFNNLTVGKYLTEGYGIENLKDFHTEYKKLGALSTPAHYELVALLDELFPVIETEEISEAE